MRRLFAFVLFVAGVSLALPFSANAAVTVFSSSGNAMYTNFYGSGSQNYYTASSVLKYFAFDNSAACSQYGCEGPVDSGMAWGYPLKVVVNIDYMLHNLYPSESIAPGSDPTWRYKAGDAAGSYGGYPWQVFHNDALTANRICYNVDTTSTATSRTGATFVSPNNNSALGWTGSAWHYYDPIGNANNSYLSGIVCSTTALPVNTLNATPTSIQQGDSVTLSWDAGANADPQNTVCTPTNFTVPDHKVWRFTSYQPAYEIPFGEGNSGYYYFSAAWTASDQGTMQPDRSGSVTVSPATTTQYCYSCTNANGTTNQCTTVNVTQPTPPADATLTANPTSITTGGSSTLTWTSTDATSCSSANIPAFSGATSGTKVVSPTTTTTYSITCTGPGGTSALQTATVTVTNPPLTPSCSPSVTDIGVSQNMTWFGSATGGTGTGYTYVWVGDPPLQGVTGATQNTVYVTPGTKTVSVTVTDSSGTSATTNCGSITVRPAITPGTCSVTPNPATTGQLVTWSVSAPSGGTGSYTYSWSSAGGSPAGGTGSSFSTTYSSNGTYIASVTITSGTQSIVKDCSTDIPGGEIVNPPTYIDITATSTPTGPTNVTTNAAGSFSGTVGNIGTGAASSVQNVMQVLDSAGTTHLAYFSAGTAGTIGVNGSVAVSGTVPANSYPFNTPGTYKVRFCGNMNTSGTILQTEGGGTPYGNNCGPTKTVAVSNTLSTTCSVNPTTISMGGSTSWTAYPAGGTAPYTYSWSTPSGTPTSGTTNPLSVSYASSGTYAASVTVTDSLGASTGAVACTNNADANGGTSDGPTVTVTAPDITATSTPTGNANVTVNGAGTYTGTVGNIGTASASSVPNVLDVLNSTGTTHLAYFSAGTAGTIGVNGSVAVSGTVPANTYPFNTAGTYRVRFCGNMNTSGVNVITEGTGQYGNNCGPTFTVTVSNALTATCSVNPTTITSGGSTSWTAYPAGGTAPYTYAWTTTGGAPSSGTTNPLSVSYSSTGTYSGSVTVTDSLGASTGAVACTNNADANGGTTDGPTVTVNPPPYIDITSTSTPTGTATITANSADTFTGTVGNIGTQSASNVVNVMQVLDSSGVTSLAYFSAGTASTIGVNGSVAVSGTVPANTYPFNTAGTYRVRFCGNMNTSGTLLQTEGGATPYSNNCSPTMTVTVNAAVPLSATCSAAPNPITAGGSTTWTAAPSGGTAPYTYLWTTTGGSPSSGTASTINPTYASAGTYSATVRVTDSLGAQVTPTCSSSLTVNAASSPDLVAINTSNVTVYSAQSVSLPATAKNQGTASSGSNFAVYYVDADATHTSDTATWGSISTAISVSPLLANGTQDISQTWTAPTVASVTTYYYQYCVDWFGQVSEGTETNNCSGWQTITINPPAQANLTSTTTPTGTTSFTQGTASTLNGTVGNTGGATGSNVPNVLQVLNAAGTVSLGYFAATPATVTIGPNGQTNVSGTVPANTAPFNTPGTYQTRFCANMNTSGVFIVTESNYGDNCGPTTTVTVNAVATPAISSCVPTPSSTNPNTNVTWNITTTGFSPSPTSYTWNATGGSPASGSGSSASFTTAFASAGSYSPTVSATNGSQSAGPFTCSPVTVAGEANTCSDPLSQTITATPSHVTSGGSVTVAWSVTGMTAGQTCTVNGVDVGGTSVNTRTTTISDAQCQITSSSSNSVTITNITTQRTYEIDCGGTKKKVVVNVLPNIVEF